MVRTFIGVIGLVLVGFLPWGAGARADKVLSNKEITVEPIDLGSPSATVIGQPLRYPKGRPVLSAFKITIPPGKATSRHLHEVGIFAYVVSGTLEVDYGAKGRKRFGPGAGLLEAVNWCHRGRAVGDAPVVLVALYLGAPPLKNTVPCGTPGDSPR
ncbi:MAG: cupin domain-containing protein [Alphaproteobacteria bacterium]|nr:cupin domain-containing protein [Alphaproteobacteria bacterium]